MNVIVTLDDSTVTCEITDVHPVALADAVRYAVDAGLTLHERLNASETS